MQTTVGGELQRIVTADGVSSVSLPIYLRNYANEAMANTLTKWALMINYTGQFSSARAGCEREVGEDETKHRSHPHAWICSSPSVNEFNVVRIITPHTQTSINTFLFFHKSIPSHSDQVVYMKGFTLVLFEHTVCTVCDSVIIQTLHINIIYNYLWICNPVCENPDLLFT